MSDHVDLDDLDVIFADGEPPPPQVVADVDAWMAAQPRLTLPKPTTSTVDAFFENMAEEIKRARGGDL